MTIRSPSTPSEGEIVESDSEKATTSLRMINDANVDSQSRLCASVSPSLSPDRSPRRGPSRTPSRSPYRKLRAKRLRERDDDNDDDFDRSRSDSRRFKVRYVDHSMSVHKTSRNRYDDLDRSLESDSYLRYEDRTNYGRMGATRMRTQSRSPFHQNPSKPNRDERMNNERNIKHYGSEGYDRDSKGYTESRSRLSRPESVSDRGHSSVAAAPLRRDTENRTNQKTEYTVWPLRNIGNSIAEYVVTFSCNSSLILILQEIVWSLLITSHSQGHLYTHSQSMKLR